MQKDFDNWNKRKKEIDTEEPNFYHEREIRWCSLGVNIGFEQDGTSKTYRRPVLIDTKRLHDRLIILNKGKFDEIRKAVRGLI